MARNGRTGSLSSVYKERGLYLEVAPIFTSKVCQSGLWGNASLSNLSNPFKLTISDIYNRSQQPPSAAHYHHPLPHLLFLWCLNWLTVFALVIGCLLDRLMPPVGLPGQTGRQRGRGGCETITVIRMQSLLKLKHPADIIHFSPGGRWEHCYLASRWRRAGRSEQTDCWFGHEPTSAYWRQISYHHQLDGVFLPLWLRVVCD